MWHLMDPPSASTGSRFGSGWSCSWVYLGVGLWALSDKMQRVQLIVMAGDGPMNLLYHELTELRPHPDEARLRAC